ncbi:MAG: hypothetical protein U9R28_11235 [Pseudomonadota bacterium]|nr:hypothetical protein [Pseudomonadota bacterium]
MKKFLSWFQSRSVAWFIGSLFLANIVSISSMSGLFNLSDSFLLAHVSDVKLDQSQVEDKYDITLIGLSPEWYEESNYESSPLNRNAIANVLNELSKQPIDILAVDLDLSPSLDISMPEGQRHLDKQIIALSKQLDVLILPVPFPAYSQSLSDAKVAWMKKMCDNDVYFASATQNINFWMGKTIAYINDVSSIQKQGYNLAESLYMAENKQLEKCSIDSLLLRFVKGNDQTEYAKVRNQPINISAYNQVQHIDFESINDEVIKSKVALLGLDNGRSDYFSLSGKKYAGFHFHALNYASLKQPVERKPVISFTLDLIFSFILIFAVSYLVRLKTLLSWQCVILKNLLITFLKILLFILVLVLLLKLMPIMLSYGVWDNLFAVLLAVYLFLFLESHSKTDEGKCPTYITYIKYSSLVLLTAIDIGLMLW